MVRGEGGDDLKRGDVGRDDDGSGGGTVVSGRWEKCSGPLGEEGRNGGNGRD